MVSVGAVTVIGWYNGQKNFSPVTVVTGQKSAVTADTAVSWLFHSDICFLGENNWNGDSFELR